MAALARPPQIWRPALLAWIAVSLVTLVGVAHGRSFSPPNRRTEAPAVGGGNESTCVTHHSTFAPANSGVGSLAIGGPPSYEPGETYLITVQIEHPDQTRWGFELTAIDDADLLQAGSFATLDALVQISADDPISSRDYVKHTTAGTAFGQPDSQQWSFEWTAPDEDVGPVSFYAAGNAANGNGTSFGDYIYTTTFRVLPEPSSSWATLATLLALGRLARRPGRRAPSDQ